MEALEVNQVLVLAAIATRTGAADALVDGEFAAAAAEHHQPERNPWSVSTRLRALAKLLPALAISYPGKEVVTCALPRPDFDWNTVTAWFPQSRSWVIPSAGESFDETKAEFFRRKGDAVVRYNDATQMSGRILRELWREGRTEELVQFLPDALRDVYIS
jgi:hypothetical protein